MGMDANILCIGSFRENIVNCLNYPEEDYKGTKGGVIVTTTLCTCNTSDQSQQLAKALSINDPYDFNQHHIDKDKIDWDLLVELSENGTEWGVDHIKKLRTLIYSGFVCIYQPNY